MNTFVVKDSGEREQFDSGMQRDTESGKPDYTLVLDGPMLERWAEHLTKGAQKYAPRNWMKAAGDAELERFRRSAFRHFLQWMRGDTDEDHAAAVMFNINGAEYVYDQRDRQDWEDWEAIRAEMAPKPWPLEDCHALGRCPCDEPRPEA